ncbi:MAG TPA: hypothetical protein VD927_04160 [Chryseosolibacter sp.]|nr:hypothetical protein [Chryseosolibacter sp.]
MRIFVLLLMLMVSVSAFSQKGQYQGLPSLIWPKLYDISFTKATDANGEYEKPVFSEAAKSLKGKKITLPGYMIPFENGIRGKHFMLSSLPINACFFCGVGGPESVIEVFLNNEVTYTESPIQVQGVLVLNETNPDKMIYILENAELLGDFEF